MNEPALKKKSLTVSMVPPQECVGLWDLVVPHFEEAVERSYGRWNLAALLKDLSDGRQQLWIVFDETGYIQAAITTQIICYPAAKMLALQFLGGSDMDEWGKDFLDTVESFARDSGCQRVEGVARFGFWPTMKRFGYEKRFAVYEKAVTENSDGQK
jgi:hypothetical protein